MIRLWLTSTAIGTLTAWYSGLDPFAPYLYEFIILGTLAFGAGFLILVAGVLGSSIVMLLVVGALPLAMGYSERILHGEIKPSRAFHRAEIIGMMLTAQTISQALKAIYDT